MLRGIKETLPYEYEDKEDKLIKEKSTQPSKLIRKSEEKMEKLIAEKNSGIPYKCYTVCSKLWGENFWTF